MDHGTQDDLTALLDAARAAGRTPRTGWSAPPTVNCVGWPPASCGASGPTTPYRPAPWSTRR